MRISAVPNYSFAQPVTVNKQDKKTNPQKAYSHNVLDLSGVYNKGLISFKGYEGNREPLKKLFWILKGNSDVYEHNDTKNFLYRGGDTGWKKWVNRDPGDLLQEEPISAIQSICTLTKKGDCFPGIPSFIPTPDYGSKWGRRANYIEINPRTIALTQGDSKREGLLSAMKLLPAIPPSPKSFANCVILSQLYPSTDNDGHTGRSSLYTVNLHSGISKNLTSDGLWRDGQHLGDDEQVKAFNDLAHLRGLKTGIRMPLSSGQMQVKGQPFDWYHHEKSYIDACCWAVDLGFDAIYFDSAKHVGGYDMGNYRGSGSVPNYGQMQYITQQIREKTGRGDIALIGEKGSDDHGHFKGMGLTAGDDWSKADNFDSVLHEYDKQHWDDEYAAGPVISDDNDNGGMSYGQRLNRVKNALHGFRDVGYKLPTFMQMHDLFPLNYSNSHEEMEYGKNHSAYGDVTSHYNNIFAKNDAARGHREAVYNEFRDVMYL